MPPFHLPRPPEGVFPLNSSHAAQQTYKEEQEKRATTKNKQTKTQYR